MSDILPVATTKGSGSGQSCADDRNANCLTDFRSKSAIYVSRNSAVIPHGLRWCPFWFAKGYYVNLGVPAVKCGSMVQHVDTGWAATHYPR